MAVRNLAALLALVCTPVLSQPVPSYCDVDTSGADWAYRCKVKLSVNRSGDLVISAEPFELPSGLPVKAVWVLTQSNYFFASGDGIKLQNSSGQFSDACASSDDQGKCVSAAKPQKFRWIVSNGGVFKEPYCIVFHDNGGRVYSFDPTINNSFGFTKVGISAVIPPSSCTMPLGHP